MSKLFSWALPEHTDVEKFPDVEKLAGNCTGQKLCFNWFTEILLRASSQRQTRIQTSCHCSTANENPNIAINYSETRNGHLNNT